MHGERQRLGPCSCISPQLSIAAQSELLCQAFYHPRLTLSGVAPAAEQSSVELVRYSGACWNSVTYLWFHSPPPPHPPHIVLAFHFWTGLWVAYFKKLLIFCIWRFRKAEYIGLGILKKIVRKTSIMILICLSYEN